MKQRKIFVRQIMIQSFFKRETHIRHLFSDRNSRTTVWYMGMEETRRGERETHSVQKCTKRFTSSIEMYSSLKLARKNIQTVELSFANNNRKTITVAHISIPKSIPSWAYRRQEWQFYELFWKSAKELTIWIQTGRMPLLPADHGSWFRHVFFV